MCVRYVLEKYDAAIDLVAQALKISLVAPEWAKAPRYNITLTHVVPVVEAPPRVRPMRWGFVPAAPGGQPVLTPRKMIPNAKSETAIRGGPFRDALERRRCLVPADGFYEWRAERGGKQPYLFTLANGEAFCFAGCWQPGESGDPPTFGILTTAPNPVVAPIHDRMPVVLTRETMARWVGSEPLPPAEYQSLTAPLPAAELVSRPVNRFVNSTRHDGPKCISPPDPEEPELALF